MKTCSGCGKQVESRVLPFGWFTIKDPGEYLVCSTRCMDSIYDELNKVHAQAQAEWQANEA